jgi:hypothetical protein
MNIVTICHLDDWVETHLTRFIHLTRKAMPSADLHVLVPTTSRDTEQSKTAFAKSAEPYFKTVKFVNHAEMNGRLLYYDLLRAESTELLNIKECLYIDVDTDVLEDMSDIPSLSPDAVVMVPNSVVVGQIYEDLQRHGITNGTQVEPGLFYTRTNFRPALEDILGEGKINRYSIGPGLAAYAVLRYRMQAYLIPIHYHITTWRIELIDTAKSLHFVGPSIKCWRLRTSYIDSGVDEYKKRHLVIGSQFVNYIAEEYPDGIKLRR